MDFLPENDGIDHINIYSKGKTQIGRWLSNFTYSPIEIPGHGNFKSIEGYWYWLGLRDERFRNLIGYEAKKLGRELSEDSVEIDEDEFKDYILKALDIKLKSNREMMYKFALTTLPFEHYYVFGGIKRDAGYKWLLEHFENRRELLKEWSLKFSAR